MKFTPNVLPEFDECKQFISWCDIHPLIKYQMVHIPNEAIGYTNKFQGARLKSIGVRAGIPDFFLPMAAGTYHGLFIEMKRVGSEKHATRDNQQNWIDTLNCNGYKAMFCYGALDAIKAVEAYLADTCDW